MAASTSYAGFWQRVIAFLIDGVIVNAAVLAVGFVAATLLRITLNPVAGGDPSSAMSLVSGLSALIYVLALVLPWLYFALMESSSRQATLGKSALGLIVTDENGGRVSFGRATGRFFGKFVSSLILYIGFLMVAFTDKKQGLHDIMAGTLVIDKE